jgi:hypothetical protein
VIGKESMAHRRRKGYTLYSVKDLLEIEPDPNLWIVRNVIPKLGRVLAFGRGGAYKSTLFFDLAVAVASSGQLMEQIPICTAGTSIVLSTEGSVYSTRARLLSHMRSRNVVPDSVNLFFGRQPLHLDIDRERDIFERIIKQHRPLLVVIDPYVSFFSGDENDTVAVKEFVNILDYFIDEYKFTVVVIHHANKLGEIRGSTVIQGWSDAVLRFASNKKTQVPGLPEPVNVLTVHADKQRDGPDGKVFSAVPFINEELGMVTFGIFNQMDSKMVLAAHLKQQALQLLRQLSRQDPSNGLTRYELQQALKVGADRMGTVLEWLLRDKAIEAVEVRRACGQGRYRRAPGFRAIGSRIDAASAILRMERERRAAEEGSD